MPKLKVKDLIPDDANFNTGTEFGNSLIDKSLSKFGAGRSILLDKNNRIIAGNKTIENAAANGFNDIVVVETTGKQIVAVKRTDIDLNTKKGREMALADNATAKANISWDAQTLTEWEMPLQEWGIDLSDITEVEPAGEADAEPQIDKAAELNKKWGVVSGDLWQIGEHRLLCGDSTRREDVERLMNGQTVAICFTSPPYAQQRDYKAEFADKLQDWDALMIGVFANIPANADTQILVNLGLVHKDSEWQPYWEAWMSWMRQEGWRRFGWYVWDKLSAMPGDWAGRFAPTFEFIWHFNRNAVKPNKTQDCKDAGRVVRGRSRKASGELVVHTGSQKGNAVQDKKIPDDVIRCGTAKGQDSAHPAVFPIALPTQVIQAWDGNVYEPFAGSGTTMIACENLHRDSFCMELSPDYCAVILERMATAFPELEIKRIDA